MRYSKENLPAAGDMIIVHKPHDSEEFPRWPREMDYLDGSLQKVIRFQYMTEHTVIDILRPLREQRPGYEHWCLNPEWCEPAAVVPKEEPSPATVEGSSSDGPNHFYKGYDDVAPETIVGTLTKRSLHR